MDNIAFASGKVPPATLPQRTSTVTYRWRTATIFGNWSDIIPALVSQRAEHGTEFTSKTLYGHVRQRDIRLDFERRGKPVYIAYIESVMGKGETSVLT